jgi:hypothetical protein
MQKETKNTIRHIARETAKVAVTITGVSIIFFGIPLRLKNHVAVHKGMEELHRQIDLWKDHDE